MINDPQIVQEIQSSWAGVERLARHPENYCLPGFPVTRIVSAGPPELLNLPLFLAYSVLDNVLSQLRDQGLFACQSWMLGKKMVASKQVLPWQNYALIDQGRDRRNDLAHQAIYVPRAECKKYITAVGAELKAWGIVV